MFLMIKSVKLHETTLMTKRKETMMSDHQLQPFEQVELGEKKDRLQIFEETVLRHQGSVSSEDSGSAPLPESLSLSHPYKPQGV